MITLRFLWKFALIYSIHLFNNYLYLWNSAEVKVHKRGCKRRNCTKLFEPKRRRYTVCAEFHGKWRSCLE